MPHNIALHRPGSPESVEIPLPKSSALPTRSNAGFRARLHGKTVVVRESGMDP